MYVSAFLLPDGKSIFDYSQSTPGFASLLLPQYLVVEPDKGISSIKPDGLREVFLADASDEDYAWASAHTQIDYLAPSGTQVSLDGGFGRVPRFYVETSQDRAVPSRPSGEAALADRVAGHVVTPALHRQTQVMLTRKAHTLDHVLGARATNDQRGVPAVGF